MNLVLDKARKKLIEMGLPPPHAFIRRRIRTEQGHDSSTETYLTDEEYENFLVSWWRIGSRESEPEHLTGSFSQRS